MPDASIYRFHHVLVSADDFGIRDFWMPWRWKMDPFRIRTAAPLRSDLLLKMTQQHDRLPKAPQKPDLLLTNALSPNPEQEGPWCSVQLQSIGMFRLETFLNLAGETLWKYYRASTGEVYICLQMNASCTEIRLLKDESGTAGELAFSLLGFLMPAVMLRHDVITFHGVLMEHDGRGVIISGPSGIGKSTHARLWRDGKHALILNGDRACCMMESGEWIGFSLPWCGTSGECICRDVPLTAFVALEQAETNSVERLEGLDAFYAVLQNPLYPLWDREMTETALDLAAQFSENIPVFRLRCRPDFEAVEVLEQALDTLSWCC